MIAGKKGFEFSVGIIVLLIISLLIFSLSIYFMFKWFGEAKQLESEVDRRTREQMIDVLKAGNQLVVLPFSVQDVKKGDFAEFALGVRNVVTERSFSFAISFSSAYFPNGIPITVDKSYVNQNWLGNFVAGSLGTIKRNEEKLVQVTIRAAPNIGAKPTVQGDYVFNLCIYAGPPVDCSIAEFENNPGRFYTGKIYQVTVRVV